MNLFCKRSSFLAIIIAASSFHISEKSKASPEKSTPSDSIRPTKTYSSLVFNKVETLASPYGTKSVLFNSTGTKLYAVNLDAMSINEFDEATKLITREFRFKPKKAAGWDYHLNTSIPSFEEKPVEACFSHQDKILWVSLHNAAGIVPFMIDSFQISNGKTSLDKCIYVLDQKKFKTDTVNVPLIKTGRTPKIIAKTADSNYLLVSNWHSQTISVLRINDTIAPYGKIISTIRVSAFPRGIVVDNKHHKSYVAVMGGRTISVINHKTWKIEKNIPVAFNPRHIVMDTLGHLFVSFNQAAQVACIDARTGHTLFTANTHAMPRTIALSKNQKFLFVTCYTGNSIDVFKINNKSFTRIYSLFCPGKPIGIDLFEDENKLEAWVCNYTRPNLKVFSFKKMK